MHSTVQCTRLADRGGGLVIFAEEKAIPRIIFRDFGRISCDFRLDIRDFGKKNVRSRETRKNQGNLEAAVKGNSHGGLAGMLCKVHKALRSPVSTLGLLQ